MLNKLARSAARYMDAKAAEALVSLTVTLLAAAVVLWVWWHVLQAARGLVW